MDAYQMLRASNTPYLQRMNEELSSLAKSIEVEGQTKPESHGLVNAITVFPIEGNRYMIETGEMRFWAMLHLRETTEPMWRQNFTAIPSIVIEQGSASRQAAENIQRRNMNSMEMAWALQRVWDELASNPPAIFVTNGNKNTSERGRPLEWPTWAAVAKRVGMRVGPITRYTVLLQLEPEAQQIIHQFDIPEGRLRYMMRMLPPSIYNSEITELLRQATVAQKVWTEARFREETDKILGGPVKTPSPRLATKRLKGAAEDLKNIFQLTQGKVDPEALWRYREIHASDEDIQALLELHQIAREILPYVQMVASWNEGERTPE